MSPFTVLLDIDGTLLDSNEAHAASWSDALRACGYAICADKVLPLIGMGGDKVMATLVPGLAPDDGGLGQKIAEQRARIFSDEYLRTCKPTPGARDLLLELQRRGCALVMATSAKGSELKALLRAAGIADLIDDAATNDDADASKPDPDIVHAALKKAQVSSERATMIGDTPYDILAAQAAGVKIVAVRCGKWKEPELSQAQGVYDDPADILHHLNDEPLRRLFPSSSETARALR
ncbi:MAG: HAD family hydrolase [Candidatus Baltobacteraceae bacterium]